MRVLIYALYDPRNGRHRYIGKTKDTVGLRKRLSQHISDARRRPGECPRFAWINKLLVAGFMPSIELLESVDESAWQVAETRWIAEAKARVGNDLLNATNGGDGIHGHSHSELTKMRQRAAALLRYSSPIEKEKTGAAVKAGMAHPEVREILRRNAKKKFSDPEFLAVLSRRSKEYSNRPEVRAARSAMLKGRKFSIETRRKISEAAKGRMVSQETRKKQSIVRLGRKHSEATIQKMRASAAARSARLRVQDHG